MKTIPYEVKTGADNMQTDNDLLEYAIENHLKNPVFRLYGACLRFSRAEPKRGFFKL